MGTESSVPGRVGKFGFNCRLSTSSNMGTYDLRVVEIRFGLNVISNEAEARSRKAFYPVVTTSSSFAIDFMHKSWEERERFNRWMSRFMRRSLRGRGINGVMHIEIPARDFVRDAIPISTLTYGEAVGDQAYTSTLDFKGASNAIDTSLGGRKAGYTVFKAPEKKGPSRYFYPGSEQLSGAAALDGAIYESHYDGQPVSGESVREFLSPRAADLSVELGDS